MNVKNRIFRLVFNPVISKNIKFKNKHKDESCYVIGNGASLKYFDISKFTDKVSIGCSLLNAHNDFELLDLRYYYVSAPLFFYSFWRNPYTKRYEKNRPSVIYRKKIKKYSDVQYFTSISNFFGLRGENINYVYHFDFVNDRDLGYEMDKYFTMMSGSMIGMIGIALYLGFKDITLIGCDYTFIPKMRGHFYENGQFSDSHDNVAFQADILRLVQKKIKIRSITPNETYRGHIIPSITYSDLVGEKEFYKENNLLVSEEDLREMNLQNMIYKIYS